MLGVLIGIGLLFLFLIPAFMIIASAVICYGWWKGARDRKRAAALAARNSAYGIAVGKV